MLKEKLRLLDTIQVMLLTIAILDGVLFVCRVEIRFFLTADIGGLTRINADKGSDVFGLIGMCVCGCNLIF